MRLSRIRPFGGLAGIAVALAGGLGVAVGTYSLPELHHANVGADVYANHAQADAVWSHQDAEGYVEVRINIQRGARSGTGLGYDHGSPSAGNSQQYNTAFSADIMRCPEQPEGDHENCYWESWHEQAPEESFTFDPAMQSARFVRDVDGCTFDITWTGQGQIAPVANLGSFGSLPGHEGPQVFGSAQVSRVAPARIIACFRSIASAPGYLSAGLYGGGIGATVDTRWE